MTEAPKSNPENLLALINAVYNGKVVVPEFQRSFVWARDNIEEFLTSILHGYFMGTFLMLDTPSNKPMFHFNPLEGVKKVNPNVRPKEHTTVQLVLDGQQRITSLFYAVYEPDVPLKGAKYPYRFYLNLDKALSGELDDSVVGISIKDNQGIAKFEQLCLNYHAVPFSLLRDSSRFYEWLYRKQSVWQDEELNQIKELYERLQQFMVPVISLSKDTSSGDIVNIFERINRTGVSLSLFDLAVAQLYLNEINLRDLWENFEKKYKVITSVVKPEFILRIIALLEGKEIRRRSLLDAINMEADKFQIRWNQAIEGVIAAHKRITQEYGAFNDKWIPYLTLIVPLAVLLYKLKEKSAGAVEYQKLDRWYWGCVLSRRYDGAADSKTHQDVREIGDWINGGSTPQWLQLFDPQELTLDIDEPKSALYKGIMGLIVRQGAKDFHTGGLAKLNECQDDHIFPRAGYRDLCGELVDSILNRTLIWEPTNKIKTNKEPMIFFEQCLVKHGNNEAKLLSTLSSHFISKDAYYALKENNFDKFITYRRNSLIQVIKELFLTRLEDDFEIEKKQNSLLIYQNNTLPSLEAQKEEHSDIEALPPIPSHLNRQDLAKRLGFHPDTIVRKRLNKNFTEWTKEHDVNGIGWIYSEETNLYYPQKP
jgi:hypothetical protein